MLRRLLSPGSSPRRLNQTGVQNVLTHAVRTKRLTLPAAERCEGVSHD